MASLQAGGAHLHPPASAFGAVRERGVGGWTRPPPGRAAGVEKPHGVSAPPPTRRWMAAAHRAALPCRARASRRGGDVRGAHLRAARTTQRGGGPWRLDRGGLPPGSRVASPPALRRCERRDGSGPPWRWSSWRLPQRAAPPPPRWHRNGRWGGGGATAVGAAARRRRANGVPAAADAVADGRARPRRRRAHGRWATATGARRHRRAAPRGRHEAVCGRRPRRGGAAAAVAQPRRPRGARPVGRRVGPAVVVAAPRLWRRVVRGACGGGEAGPQPGGPPAGGRRDVRPVVMGRVGAEAVLLGGTGRARGGLRGGWVENQAVRMERKRLQLWSLGNARPWNVPTRRAPSGCSCGGSIIMN